LVFDQLGWTHEE
jgi:hypothetical protein